MTMNRRGFLTGLAATLATSALVKMPAPEPVFVAIDRATSDDYTAVWVGTKDHVYMICSTNQWLDLTRDYTDWSYVSGEIGEYRGIQIRETCAQPAT